MYQAPCLPPSCNGRPGGTKHSRVWKARHEQPSQTWPYAPQEPHSEPRVTSSALPGA